MRIVIDAHMLGEQEGGNETYIAGLLQGLQAIHPHHAEITALYQQNGYRPPAGEPFIRYRSLHARTNLQRLFAEIPQICRSARADLLHVTYNAPPVVSCRTVVSVHDVIFRRMPAYFSPRVRLLLSTLLPLSMRRASAILTLSEASRRDIEHFYPFTSGKIKVISLAPGPLAAATPDPEEVERVTQGQPFVLAVGTVQPRKNITRLIQSYTLARQRGAPAVKLVIVGRSAWHHSSAHAVAEASPFRDDIVFTGYVPDSVVAGLYARCSVFVYPSLYEGFGLPVLEAMACGAATVTSKVSSLPEVAGDAALLVDPYSIEELSNAIAQVLEDPTVRDDLRARGMARAAQFTWDRTARETLSAYACAVAKERIS
jgi:glycosyltransferase involved in cell wall biosynthesis